MLLGGCSNISNQTLAYSEISRKFAYIGDAHLYIFDTNGLCRLDSTIPFCEKSQSLHVEEQKAEGKIATKNKSQAARSLLVKEVQELSLIHI